MRKATILGLCIVLAGCTFPLGYVQPQGGKTPDQQKLDTLDCKDKAHLEASSTGRQVGYFFLGMTIIGTPAAYALDRDVQRSVFKECMEGRGYTVIPAEEGPQTAATP
ncbi:MAG: hypothetical protein ABSD47_14030 [Candidatus Methylomirabilota bacterium]|jgi:hypothetical protein